ncbi:MAG: ribosome small subunit-dependent GTPase A [Clostridia bacterium]|nr:ribosome small subunit-dependent GTPase A [Clostridia bacterium]
MSIIEKKGLVLSGKNGRYTVECENEIYICPSGTRVRKNDGKILAGDLVVFRDNGDGNGFITALLPRKNFLVRPPVANIDLLAMVVAPKDPMPYFYNIDLLSVIAEKNGIECAIIVSKNDLDDCAEILDIYRKTNFKVVVTSSENGLGIDEARELLSGKISVLCGASGVGKSTLLNSIYPYLNLETGSLSEKIARGKNTTRTTELFRMGDNTYLADTPGFTAVNTELYCTLDHKELCSLFPEFDAFKSDCRYADCTHTKEEECGIADAVKNGDISESRHESYKKLYFELKSIDRYK